MYETNNDSWITYRTRTVNANAIMRRYGRDAYKEFIMDNLECEAVPGKYVNYDRLEYDQGEVVDEMWESGMAPVRKCYVGKKRELWPCLMSWIKIHYSAGVRHLDAAEMTPLHFMRIMRKYGYDTVHMGDMHCDLQCLKHNLKKRLGITLKKAGKKYKFDFSDCSYQRLKKWL